MNAASMDSNERAMQILNNLPGTWQFTLGKLTGMRILRVLYPGSVVEWSEKFDNRDIEGKGFIGYDQNLDLFFSMTVHNSPGTYDFMTGRLEGDTIVFEPSPLPQGGRPFKSIFRTIAKNRFTYTAMVKGENEEWSQAWVAAFERQGE